jgi:ornithine decarboxylase
MAYRQSMQVAIDVVRASGVEVSYVDIGGGFPADYGDPIPPLEAYFDVIRAAKRDLAIDVPLYAEPGRALVADGCSVLAQVQLRKGDDLYINDGIYGGLSEIHLADLRPPVRAIAHKGNGSRVVGGDLHPFRLFGPTCDSLDVFKVRFDLPSDIAEGDWIEFARMGAYSIGMQSGFNGFFTDTVVQVSGASTISGF